MRAYILFTAFVRKSSSQSTTSSSEIVYTDVSMSLDNIAGNQVFSVTLYNQVCPTAWRVYVKSGGGQTINQGVRFRQ